MSEATDEIRALATKANECRTEGAIGFLVLAVEALCDALDAHQHSYVGPTIGLTGAWYTTGPERDTTSAAAAAYAKQKNDAKKGTP